MIHSSVVSCIGNTPLVALRRLFPQPGLEVIAKLEFLNPGGSIKDRPARYMIEQGLQEGTINASSHLIESSSGNLGIALALVAKLYDLPFTCVVDPKLSPANGRILAQLGARIDMVSEQDANGGYLQTRIRRVQHLLQTIPNSVWINQYANPRNWQAHYEQTATEILAELDRPVDCMAVAVSTTGTILGLARRLRLHFPRLRVIAVDAAGSVLFGGPAGPREIPGIGASRVPELFDPTEIDEVVYVADWEAARGCRELVRHEGILAGGSSGSVVAGLAKLVPHLPRPQRILTVLPDRGERYLETVYNEEWAASLLPAAYQPHQVGLREIDVAG